MNYRGVPYCEVDIHTDTKLYSVNSVDGARDPSMDIIRVNTHKQLSSTAGSFTLDIVYNEEWYNSINPMDVVVIKMGNLGHKLNTVMVGLVDEVRKTITVGGNGKPTTCIRITGRDFGKVFLKCMIEFFPEIGDMPTQEALRSFFVQSDLQHGRPSDLAYNALAKILPKFMNFSMVFWDKTLGVRSLDNMTILDVVRFILGSGDIILPILDTMDAMQGSLWNFITYGMDAPFIEMFIDTRSSYEDMILKNKIQRSSYGVLVRDPVTGKERMTYEGYKFGEDNAKVILIMRPTPFDDEDWNNLKRVEIHDYEIKSQDIGRSDHQHYNIFFATPKLYSPYASTPESEIRMLIKPPFNKENMRKYGISTLKVECSSLEYSPSDNFFVATKRLSETLQRWYGNNHKLEQGTVALNGRGDPKIGERVLLVDESKEFYLEGVSQDWNASGNNPEWGTILTITRGKKI